MVGVEVEVQAGSAAGYIEESQSRGPALSISSGWPVPGFSGESKLHLHLAASLNHIRSSKMRKSIFRASRAVNRLYSTIRHAEPAQTSPKPPSNPNKRNLEDLTPSDLCYYWDTKAPNTDQLAFADKIFIPSRHSPIKLWSASKFRTTPLSSIEPEVAFLGRSNVGKSSLLNAIMGQEICWTSSKPGRTREMNAFGIGGTKGGESKVVLLDMPGYGKASRAEWGMEIMKYLQGRKQFVLSLYP